MENVEISEIQALIVKLAKCPQCGDPWWFNFTNAKICANCANTILKAGTSEAQEFTRNELQLMMHALMLASKELPSTQTQGDTMSKVDALAAQATADGTLYDTAFADGVASVGLPSGTVGAVQEQADIAAAVKTASDPLNAQISALQLAKTTEDALLAQVQTSLQTVVNLFTPVAPAAPAAPAPAPAP